MDVAATIRKGFTRWQASGLHLLISAAIAAAVLTLMLGLWYPPPLFEAEGGMGLVFILVAVDVVIGPLITLIIFRSGKPGLKFDLSVIAAFQLAALIYGGYVVFEVRPVFLVLVKGQFEVVNAVDLKAGQLARAKRPEFRRRSLTGPVLVFSDPPSDESERQRIILSVLSGGPDLQHRPEYYVPYAERTKEALAAGHSLNHARRTWPEGAQQLERYLAETGRKAPEVVYFPGRAPVGWLAAVADAKSGEILKLLFVPDP